MNNNFNNEDALRLARELQSSFTKAGGKSGGGKSGGGKSGSRRAGAGGGGGGIAPINRENVRPTHRPIPTSAPAHPLVTDFNSFLSGSSLQLEQNRTAVGAPRDVVMSEAPPGQQTRAGHGFSAAPVPQAAVTFGQGPAFTGSQLGSTSSFITATAGPYQQSQPAAAVGPSTDSQPISPPTRQRVPPTEGGGQPGPSARQPDTAAPARPSVTFGLSASRHARETEQATRAPAPSVPAPKPAVPIYVDFPPDDPRHKMIKVDLNTGRYIWKNDEGHWEFHTFGSSKDCKYVPDGEAPRASEAAPGLGSSLHVSAGLPGKKPARRPQPRATGAAPPGTPAKVLDPRTDSFEPVFGPEDVRQVERQQPMFDPEERFRQLKAQLGSIKMDIDDEP